jgi:alanine racemase
MSRSDGERVWAEIDCEALRHNARVARQHLGGSAALMAVIKANGYGHGLAEVAQALRDDAQLFGVANLQEANRARAVVPHPVLILGPALPAEREEIVSRRFIASVSSLGEAQAFAAIGDVQLNCKIDTGMGRMGIPAAAAVEQVRQIAALPRVKIHSVSTHLPSGDEDPVFTSSQLAGFHQLLQEIRHAVPGDYLVHALPSAGVLAFGTSAYDVVRPGLMLYGIAPMPEFQPLLKPAMTLKSHVAVLREVPAGTSISYGRTFTAPRAMRVATLSVGYADGLPRLISNRGAQVLISGRRCDVLGRVTMDLTMADVSHLPDVEVGDEVVLIGCQGDEEILATEVAQHASTIAWEIFTGIGSRVARVYV